MIAVLAAVGRLARREFPLISEALAFRFRDVQDNLVRLSDEAMFFQDRITSILDAHLSAVSNQLNQVMKVLTIIATIFMPLSFIASLYGMNFNTVSPWNMPELNWTLGYPFALLLMGLTAGTMLYYFYRRGWL